MGRVSRHQPDFAAYGENILKMRLSAHPAVEQRHHADLIDAAHRSDPQHEGAPR
ncbi:hypothetical protein [Amycolatopsis sp. NPDC051372]|uniref:hypothetical protein n=1 Tax=unclassified Amycolatopsis TaxID=2618356 RepID=UPI00344312EB